ncbi:MAG TPA: acyl-CoA dehydrogenase family protein, partial [Solirubrobacteraceae bacterium]
MSATDPPFGEEHEQLRESARGFIERELAPHARQWEDDEWFPQEVFGKLAAQGLLGLKYPSEYGGEGGDYLHEAVLCEEMARIGSGGAAAGIGAHINIATPPIWKFGTDEQKQRYLVPAIAGELIGALGITEPGAGSDVAALTTRAERVDGGFLVNGEKTYITNGVRADFIVTAVKTTPEGGHGGISFLIVDRGEGVESSALHKLGWRASDTATISFQDVFVPEQSLLGELHGGFKLIMANFQWERLAMALGAVGAMRLAWERTAAYAAERHAFGRPLSG